MAIHKPRARSATAALLKILLDKLREREEVVSRQLYIELIPYFTFDQYTRLIETLVKARYVHAQHGKLYYIPE